MPGHGLVGLVAPTGPDGQQAAARTVCRGQSGAQQTPIRGIEQDDLTAKGRADGRPVSPPEGGKGGPQILADGPLGRTRAVTIDRRDGLHAHQHQSILSGIAHPNLGGSAGDSDVDRIRS